MTAAACADPGLATAVRAAFTTDNATTVERDARTVCARCPVRTDCADYARHVHAPAGIWGGHRRGLYRDHHDDDPLT